MATLVVVWSWSESPTLCAACACTPLTSAFSQRCPIESSYAPCPTLGRTHDMHMMQPTLTSAVRLHPTYVASLSSYSFSNANHGCCWHRCIWGERFCFFLFSGLAHQSAVQCRWHVHQPWPLRWHDGPDTLAPSNALLKVCLAVAVPMRTAYSPDEACPLPPSPPTISPGVLPHDVDG